jgi:uncharacterized protein (UPF0332 family)
MSDRSNLLDQLLAKAGRSFEVAENLLEAGHPDFAASRAYYGSFYMAVSTPPKPCSSPRA